MSLRFGKNDAKTIGLRLSIADELAKLTNLKVQGMITEEEFIRIKQELEKSQN
jgi:hypothetical protein